jgi:hypothetical protein
MAAPANLHGYRPLQTQLKGTNFRAFVPALRALKGDAAVERTIELLPPDLAGTVRTHGFVTGGWYPAAQFDAMHRAAQKACNEGPELSRELGRTAVRLDFQSGVYRLITISLAPETLFKWGPRVVALYYDRGKIVIEESMVGRAMARFEGFHGFTRSLWEDLIGGTTGLLELGGAKNVTARILSGGQDDDSHLGVTARWTT